MNIVKLQQEIIKDYLNDKRGKWYIQIKESEVYIMSRTQVFILSPKEFVLDIDKLGLSNTNIADSLIKSAKEAKKTNKTGIIKSVICQGKDVNCLELKREDNGEIAYVDLTLLKLFDKNCDFAVINGKSPIFIYEYNILVGVVLPINLGGDKR